MTSDVERVDDYIARKGFIPLADDGLWHQIIARVLDLYGPDMYYRCVGITQQPEPLGRFFTVFPDNLTVPHRHIKYLDLLVRDSSHCNEFVDWLHSLGVPTQRVFDADGPDDAGVLRIFGYADPNHARKCSTTNS